MPRPRRFPCCEHCHHTPLPEGFMHYDPCPTCARKRMPK